MKTLRGRDGVVLYLDFDGFVCALFVLFILVFFVDGLGFGDVFGLVNGILQKY